MDAAPAAWLDGPRSGGTRLAIDAEEALRHRGPAACGVGDGCRQDRRSRKQGRLDSVTGPTEVF